MQGDSKSQNLPAQPNRFSLTPVSFGTIRQTAQTSLRDHFLFFSPLMTKKSKLSSRTNCRSRVRHMVAGQNTHLLSLTAMIYSSYHHPFSPIATIVFRSSLNFKLQDQVNTMKNEDTTWTTFSCNFFVILFVLSASELPCIHLQICGVRAHSLNKPTDY